MPRPHSHLFLLLSLLFSLSYASLPTYWINSIPNDNPGSPTVREFQTLTPLLSSSYAVLFSGVTYNGTTLNLEDTWIFDGDGAVWKLANPSTFPPARGYAVAGATPTQVILFGGHNEKVPMQFFDDIWRYDIQTNSWIQDSFTVPSPYLARSFAAGVLVVDTLYVFGGYVAALQKSGNSLWAYNITSKTWALRSAEGSTNAPAPRQGHSAVFYNDTVNGPSIIFFGGYNGTGGRSDTWQFVISTNAWIQLTADLDPSGPSPRWGHSAVIVNSTIIIFGGSYVGGAINPYYNDVWSLNAPTGTSTAWTWQLLLPDGDGEGPWKRGGHSSILSDGHLYTFGGYGMYVGLYNDVWELLNYN